MERFSKNRKRTTNAFSGGQTRDFQLPKKVPWRNSTTSNGKETRIPAAATVTRVGTSKATFIKSGNAKRGTNYP